MRILLGMSGGLDSTYAAELLRRQGHEVQGALLEMHAYTDTEAAERAAREVGIPLLRADCRQLFREQVETAFCEEYRRGRTPNPCILCNPLVKFRRLIELARQNGFDRVATGHYARICQDGGRYSVAQGADGRKDQSYMLWGLTQEQLAACLFPLGELTKDVVRDGARAEGLAAAEARESQDICFIPDGNYVGFVENRCGKGKEGRFVDTQGRVLGRHQGVLHYTVGQRRGLGVALGERMFVSEIHADTGDILLLPDGGARQDKMRVEKLNFQALAPCTEYVGELWGKVRYAAAPQKMTVRVNGDGAEVVFSEPIRAVTPGQSAVFYDDRGRIALGGLIASAT